MWKLKLIAIAAAISSALGLLAKIIYNDRRTQRLTARAAAAEDRLEMNREADDIERQAGAASDEEARRKAMKWRK